MSLVYQAVGRSIEIGWFPPNSGRTCVYVHTGDDVLDAKVVCV